jgi:hypothetical protein
LKGFVKEFDRVRLLLGHDNRPVFAEEIHRGERNLRGALKVRAANPRDHLQGLCREVGGPPRGAEEGRPIASAWRMSRDWRAPAEQTLSRFVGFRA